MSETLEDAHAVLAADGMPVGYETLTKPDTFFLIENWAHDRNLIKGSTPAAQLEKFFEECGELARALVENDQTKFEDAVGDCIVVLTILAKQRGTTIQQCINGAYEEIKDRKGTMINGKFVKE